MVQLIEHKI